MSIESSEAHRHQKHVGEILRLRLYSTPMTAWLKWIGTATGILGALWIASNVPTSGWGYLLCSLSHPSVGHRQAGACGS